MSDERINRRKLIGVKTGVVVEAPLKRTLRAVGHVAYDESTLSEVNLKVSGWITKLLVNKTGQRVAMKMSTVAFLSAAAANSTSLPSSLAS